MQRYCAKNDTIGFFGPVGWAQFVDFGPAVAPGADPKQIRWRYAGAKEIQVDGGTLVVTLPAPPNHTAPTLSKAAPIAWQDGPAGRTPVAVAYTIAQDGSIGFTLGAYDRSRTLTIDPTLTWSTTLSGSGSDAAWGVAVASDGTIALAGATTSADFPQNLGVQPIGHHGGYDAFVTKLSADGSQVLWQTFLRGSGDDHGLGLALDAQHRPVVVGWTTSTNLPTTANAVQATFGGGLCGTATPQPCTDAFITRAAADGSTLDYSSYLGGSKNEVARRVALAPDGSAVLVGETASPAFPTTAGAWQTTPIGIKLRNDNGQLISDHGWCQTTDDLRSCPCPAYHRSSRRCRPY